MDSKNITFPSTPLLLLTFNMAKQCKGISR